MNEELWKIAVEAPIHDGLTYSYSGEFGPIQVGSPVKIPLGKRTVSGVALEKSTELTSEYKIKSISEIRMEYPPLPTAYVQWVRWLSSYYLYPAGQVFKSCFPPLKKGGRTRKTPIPISEKSQEQIKLTSEQKQVFENIRHTGNKKPHLIRGITGSGKTEVYFELLEKVLEEGKRGLLLVPEISLTPQLISRFTKKFGNEVALLHSQLTDRERTNQWWSIVDKEKKILIGVRSALFCPIDDLSLIIVDEEHEPSFKQDETLRYNARDAAIVLGQLSGATVVLGSATPSLETWQNAISGKYELHQLKNRIGTAELPSVEIIDMSEAEKSKDTKEERPYWLSKNLHTKIKEHTDRKKQVAIFLNRRGEAHSLLCTDCGASVVCPNCSVNLTVHSQNHLICHYCDFHENMNETCKVCSSESIRTIGLGTEKVEIELKKLFPNLRIARADRDRISSREEMEELIDQMMNREIDILVGTQMIAKGLDFPHLTLVGIVLADLTMNLPDFRASERTFQLIVQVAGRAGRHLDAGEVVIQTYNKEHPALTMALAHKFENFAEQELESRRELLYPPFGQVAMVKVQSLHKDRAESAIHSIAHWLREILNKNNDVMILGPVKAPLFRLRGKYRYQILLRGPKGMLLSQICKEIQKHQENLPSGTKLSFDIDPIHML